MWRFSSRRSVQQEESLISFVRLRFQYNVVYRGIMKRTVLSSSLSNDRANGQHDTVVRGKYKAATSWLYVLLDNTTVDNVNILLDIKQKPRMTDWLNENDELPTEWNLLLHGNGCYAFLFLIG